MTLSPTENFDDEHSKTSPDTSMPGTKGYDLTTPLTPVEARASL